MGYRGIVPSSAASYALIDGSAQGQKRVTITGPPSLAYSTLMAVVDSIHVEEWDVVAMVVILHSVVVEELMEINQ